MGRVWELGSGVFGSAGKVAVGISHSALADLYDWQEWLGGITHGLPPISSHASATSLSYVSSVSV